MDLPTDYGGDLPRVGRIVRSEVAVTRWVYLKPRILDAVIVIGAQSDAKRAGIVVTLEEVMYLPTDYGGDLPRVGRIVRSEVAVTRWVYLKPRILDAVIVIGAQSDAKRAGIVVTVVSQQNELVELEVVAHRPGRDEERHPNQEQRQTDSHLAPRQAGQLPENEQRRYQEQRLGSHECHVTEE